MSDGPPYGVPPTPGPDPYQQQYQQPYQQPHYQQPPYQQQYHWPESSNAVTALVLSLVGLLACSGLLCPIGWYMANGELRGIAEGLRDPRNRDMAKAAQIVGIIGTALLALFFLGFLFLFGLAGLGAVAGA